MNKADLEIINTLFKSKSSSNSSKKFYFIQNKDKTIRWIYPSSLKKPSFLAFYMVSNTRSKIISILTKISFYLKVNKSIQIEIFEDSIINNIMKKFKNYDYSIFTGTAGINRKLLIELNQKATTKYFAKISLTNTSENLIKNEAETLEYLGNLDLKDISIPRIIDKNSNYIVIDNIKQDDSVQLNHLTNNHFKFLKSIYESTFTNIKLKNLDFYHQITANIRQLKSDFINPKLDKNQIQNMTKNLSECLNLLNLDEKVCVSLAHCDFTPWNIFVNQNNISVIDWELSSKDVPILYDLFLFIFQTSILVERLDYQTIKSLINKSLQNSIINESIKELNININQVYILYLTSIVSYYLNKYNHQEQLHTQSYWLINTWDEALEDILNTKGKALNE